MENFMKNLTFILCIFASVNSFAASITLNIDVVAAKESVRKAASTEMRYNQGLIQRDLDIRAVHSIIVGKDILSSSKGLKVVATVYPEEVNCDCHDVFKVEIYAELINGKLVVPNGAVVEKIESNQ